MTALYIKAAIVIAISLVAFILVTKAAWPANVMLFKAFNAWRRSLPDQWKRFRDPVYRRRRERIERYGEVFGGLYQLRARRNGCEQGRKRYTDANDFGLRLVDGIIADLDMKIEGMQLIAVEVMRSLDAEAVADIADDLNEKALGGNAPADELRSFLEEERQLIVRSPHLATDHVTRFIARFKRYAPGAVRTNDVPTTPAQ